MTDRAITNADLWAAIRGLEMTRKRDNELRELIAQHTKPGALFASKVIAEAARQTIVGKLNRNA
jgi:hypothetical protein